MPNRILKDSICTSDNLDGLTWQQEVFWYRLLVQCDDYGRMDARPAILRAKCFPLKLETVSESWVASALRALADATLILLYTVDSKPYLQIVTWEDHQQIRAKRSKYPAMISDDINGNHLISDAPVIQSNPMRESESESKGESNQPPAPPSPAPSSASSGRQQVERLKRMNAQVSPELRTPIANVVLDMTGKRAVADIGNAASDKLVADAHEAAIALYLMGYKTESQVLALEPAWSQDWRGKNGGSFKQLVEFASERLSGRSNGKSSPGREPVAIQAMRIVMAEQEAARAAEGTP